MKVVLPIPARVGQPQGESVFEGYLLYERGWRKEVWI
jgi:hypothetical protein